MPCATCKDTGLVPTTPDQYVLLERELLARNGGLMADPSHRPCSACESFLRHCLFSSELGFLLEAWIAVRGRNPDMG